MLEGLAIGAAYGLSAGVAPGPLLALVVSTSLSYGIRAGLLIAVAPLLTDLPLLLLSVTLLRELSDRALGVIALLGALFVVRLALESLQDARTADPTPEAVKRKPTRRHLRRGALANALNPHAYIFWFTIGGPQLIVLHDRDGLTAATAFAIGFAGLLVGAKTVVAVAVGLRRRVGGRLYRSLLVATAAALAVLAAILAVEAVRLIW